MKTFAIDRQPATALFLPPAVDIIVDSALTLPGKPLFLPDFDSDWTAQFYLGVRLSRLGKNISLKFAPRYYDALTLAMRLRPSAMLAGLHEAGLPDGIANAFDGALTLGEWLPLPASLDEPLAVEVGGAQCRVEHLASMIDESIAAISRYATLKMGDVVMPVRLPMAFAVKPDTVVEGRIADSAVLSVRIK